MGFIGFLPLGSKVLAYDFNDTILDDLNKKMDIEIFGIKIFI